MAARAAALACLLARALPVRGFQGALHRTLPQQAYHSHVPLSSAVTLGSSFAPAHVRVVPTTGTWGLRGRQRDPHALRMFNSGILNVGTPEMALILAVGYFVLGPQDLYKVAKETGQVWSNLRSAADDAWKVFQEAMEAEGTYQAMGKSVAEIKNMRDNFWQKFLDVRAERALDQLEEKGVNVDDYDDEWSQKIKEVKRKKQDTTKKDWDLEDEDDMDLVDGPYGRSGPYAKAGPPSQGRLGRPPPPPPGGFRPPPPMFNPYYMRPPFPPPPPMVPPPFAAQGNAGAGAEAGARGSQAQRPGWVPPPPPPPPMFYPYFPPPPPPPRQPIPQQQGPAAPGVAAPPMASAEFPPQALNATARPPMPMMPWFYPPPPPPPAFYPYPPYRSQPPQPPSPPAPQQQQHAQVAAEVGMGSRVAVEQPSAEEQEAMRSKFAAQMSGQWNQLVLDQAKAAAIAAAAVGVGDGGVNDAGFEGAQTSAADLPSEKSKEEAHAPQEAHAQKRTEEGAGQPSKDLVSAEASLKEGSVIKKEELHISPPHLPVSRALLIERGPDRTVPRLRVVVGEARSPRFQREMWALIEGVIYRLFEGIQRQSRSMQVCRGEHNYLRHASPGLRMSTLLHGDTDSPTELLLRIEAQDGCGTSIIRECVVRQGDDVYKLARAFCVSNELTDDRSPALLEEHIRSSIAILERERSHSADKVHRCTFPQAVSGASKTGQANVSVSAADAEMSCRGAEPPQHHSFVERLMSPPAEAGDMFAAESLEPLLQRCYEKIKSASAEGVTGLLPGLSDECGMLVGSATSGASQMLYSSSVPVEAIDAAGTSAGSAVSHDDRAQHEEEQRALCPKYGVGPVVEVKDAEVETMRRGDLSSPLTRQEHLEVLRQQEEALEAAVARLALKEGLDACLSPYEVSDSATASSGEACLASALERIHLIKSAVQSHNVSQGHILTLVDSLKEALQQSIITETKHRAPQLLNGSLRTPSLTGAWSGGRRSADVSRETRSRPTSAFIPQELVDAGQMSAVMQPASAWQRPVVASSAFVRGEEKDHPEGMETGGGLRGAATATRDSCESDEDKVRGEGVGSDPLGVDAEELLADAVDAAATTRQTVERYQRIVREVGASPSRTMLHDALPRDDVSTNDSDDEYGF